MTPHTDLTRAQLSAWDTAVAEARRANTLDDSDPTDTYTEEAVDAALFWLTLARVAGAESPRLVAFGM